MGHEVKVLGLGDNLADLRNAITDWRPDVAFNLLEEFQASSLTTSTSSRSSS